MNAPLDEIERLLRTQGREMLRTMMQAHFDQRSAQERPVEVRGADGVERTETRHGSRKVETEFGEVELGRNLYRAAGVERLAPLDATMKLPEEKYSYEVRRMRHQREGRRTVLSPWQSRGPVYEPLRLQPVAPSEHRPRLAAAPPRFDHRSAFGLAPILRRCWECLHPPSVA